MAITNITGNNNRSGGQTVTPLNWGLFNRQMYTGSTKGLEVTQTATPSMAVSVSTGLALLDYQTISSVQATILTPKTVAISTANTSNPRIDTVVIYEDTSVTMPTTEPFSADAGNGRFKLRTIDGTPAASPVALSDAAIQSIIGAGMAWTRLADVRVNANVTSIINSNITSRHHELSSNLSDSGWQNIENASSPIAGGIYVRKLGGVAFLESDTLDKPSGTAGSQLVANIPEGLRPKRNVALDVRTVSYELYNGIIASDGRVLVATQMSAREQSLSISGSWLIDQD